MNQLATSLVNIKNQDSTTCIFTENAHDIAAYSDLVKIHYQKELKIDLAANDLDSDLESIGVNERILVAKKFGIVVGGAKITISSQASPHRLPMELDGVAVEPILPNDRKDVFYAEFTRLVVSPNYRSKALLKNIIIEMTRFAKHKLAQFIFVGSPPLNAVLYRRVCRAIGMPAEIRNDVKYPLKQAYTEVKELKLVSCDISEVEF